MTSQGKPNRPPVPLLQRIWREASRPFRPRPKRVIRIRVPPPPPQPPEFDPQSCTVEPEGIEFLQRLVREAADHPGPIVEVGTLAGITATQMALVKRPDQRIITVDNYSWNPWRLKPDHHFALARQVLYYLIPTGQVEQIRQDRLEFYRTYAGPPPALVFLDAVHTYEATKEDIEWARQAQAHLIAGHDYAPRFPGVVQVVDEFGLRDLGGTVWVLRPTAQTAARRAA